jgi:uncharacterized membrane protein YvbJ
MSYVLFASAITVFFFPPSLNSYFVSNLGFTIAFFVGAVKPKLDTKYEFKDGGKKKTVIADANKTTSLGTYIYIPGI